MIDTGPCGARVCLCLCVCVYVCVCPTFWELLLRVFCYREIWFVLFVFLGPNLCHMEVPRLGVELELYPPAYGAATATPDVSCICYPHHSLPQHQILNPASEARNGTCVLMDAGQIHYR